MSHSKLGEVIERIGSASIESPIAVFATKQAGLYDAIFATTILGLARVKNDKSLIGVYSRIDNPDRVRRELCSR